jgi:hypothetical protein
MVLILTSKKMETKEIICKALNMTDIEYCQMVERFGLRWLTDLLSEDDAVVNEIAKRPLFWNWWKNQWKIRDKKFIYETSIDKINEELSGDVLLIAKNLYWESHDLKRLRVVPNKWVRDDMSKVVQREYEKEIDKIRKIKSELNG